MSDISYYSQAKINRHKELCNKLNKTYSDKNHDYGDSVHDTYKKYGMVSFLVRMEDKLNRLYTLTKFNPFCETETEMRVKDESIMDTLLDLANYAVIAAVEYSGSSKDNLSESSVENKQEEDDNEH